MYIWQQIQIKIKSQYDHLEHFSPLQTTWVTCQKVVERVGIILNPKQPLSDFFTKAEWPGSSPDLNLCEHLGSILKDRVEMRMLKEIGKNRLNMTRRKKHIVEVLQELEYDTDLFHNLLTSYPSRLEAVKNAQGGHTDLL